MDDQVKYRQARERISVIKGFYIHGLVFLLVISGLLALNLALGKPYWVLWFLFGWGAGVVLHAALVLRWWQQLPGELGAAQDKGTHGTGR